MKIKEIIFNLITIAFNILLGFLLTITLFGEIKNFIFATCAIILLSIITIRIIATKLNYKLDIFVYNITDLKYLVLNSIFIGDLFSIPIAMFISMSL